MQKIQPAFLVVVVALWLPIWFTVCSLGGCQTGTTGLLRPLSPVAEHAITNSVGIVGQASQQYVPAPYGAAIEAGAAAVLALLAAWQGLTHSKINKLEASNSNQNTIDKL